jgi:hypothetical protein
MRMRQATTFRRLAAFGAAMLLLGVLVGGVAGVRARQFAVATFRPDDRPALVALPDDPPPTTLSPTAAVAASVAPARVCGHAPHRTTARGAAPRAPPSRLRRPGPRRGLPDRLAGGGPARPGQRRDHPHQRPTGSLGAGPRHRRRPGRLLGQDQRGLRRRGRDRRRLRERRGAGEQGGGAGARHPDRLLGGARLRRFPTRCRRAGGGWT